MKSAIIHLGKNIHYGHYIALILQDNIWFKYNDNEVSVGAFLTQLFDERKLNTIYGGMSDHGAAAYILFYEKVDSNREPNRQIVGRYQAAPSSPTKSSKGALKPKH